MVGGICGAMEGVRSAAADRRPGVEPQSPPRLGETRSSSLAGGSLQILESTLPNPTGPARAQLLCRLCPGGQRLHRHGSYTRFADCSGQATLRIARFLCPRCGVTFSFLPPSHLPYRALPVARLEAGLDALSSSPAASPTAASPPAPSMGGGARPPPISEVERGCFKRAVESLLRRIPVLRGCLGQQLPSALADDDLCGFWRALRAVGRASDILLRLARDFKRSLLADYRCLRPPGDRELAPT